MIVKIQEFKDKVEEIKEEYSLSNRDISNTMGIDYTYMFRLFKQNANPGRKVIDGIEKFCQKYNLNSKDYIFLK
ncbi:MAG: hypothetical protein HFJ53_01190 [Clostridia bacterium]|nr:hypothetical protein [Clostridia bacterium]